MGLCCSDVPKEAEKKPLICRECKHTHKHKICGVNVNKCYVCQEAPKWACRKCLHNCHSGRCGATAQYIIGKTHIETRTRPKMITEYYEEMETVTKYRIEQRMERVNHPIKKIRIVNKSVTETIQIDIIVPVRVPHERLVPYIEYSCGIKRIPYLVNGETFYRTETERIPRTEYKRETYYETKNTYEKKIKTIESIKPVPEEYEDDNYVDELVDKQIPYQVRELVTKSRQVQVGEETYDETVREPNKIIPCECVECEPFLMCACKTEPHYGVCNCGA